MGWVGPIERKKGKKKEGWQWAGPDKKKEKKGKWGERKEGEKEREIWVLGIEKVVVF